MISNVENLLKRIYTIPEKNDIINQFQLELALVCFRSSFLNRRIQGLKVIQEQIKAVRFNHANKNVGQAYLLDFLTKNNLVQDIFGPQSHNQLVTRTSDLIKFLASENALEQEDVHAI